MDFLHFDLGSQSRGNVAVVKLNTAANVRLLDDANFGAYRAGRQHRTYGGLAKESPVRLVIPSAGRWHVVVDLGGYAGQVRAEVNVIAA
jgi:hypothetical protein